MLRKKDLAELRPGTPHSLLQATDGTGWSRFVYPKTCWLILSDVDEEGYVDALHQGTLKKLRLRATDLVLVPEHPHTEA